MFDKKIVSITVLSLVLLLVLGGAGEAFFAWFSSSEDEVIVYSSRREEFVRPLLESFEEETGINIRLQSGREAQNNLKIKEERNNPRADIFFANDAGVMEDLRMAGVLATNSSANIEQIPAEFRAEDGSWVGLSARARVIMYNKDLIAEEDVPSSVLDLANPKYKGQFAITRPGNGSMISHMSAIRAYYGDEQTKEFIKGILENEPEITSGHTDIRRAVGRGEVKFGLVNNYYYHLQLEEDSNNNVGAVYPDQGPDQMGTFVNVAGVALLKDSPNPDTARKFIDFLLEEEQQRAFSYNSKETPVSPHIEAVDYAKRIDQYRHADMPLTELGPVWADTLTLMEEVGFIY